MGRKKNSVDIVVNFASGGALALIFQAVVVTAIERQLNFPFSLTPDACAGSSAGGINCNALRISSLEDPSKPRFTAQQVEDLGMRHTRDILPRKINYILQYLSKHKPGLLRSVFTGATLHADHLFNQAHVREIFDPYFGNAVMGDLLGTTYISAHNFTSASAEDSSVFFTKEVSNGRETFSHGRDFPLTSATQATISAMGHFNSAEIKDEPGSYTDIGHIHSGLHALINFYDLKEDPRRPTAYIEIGTPRFSNLMTRSDYDKTTALEIVSNGFLLGATSNQSYSQNMRSIRKLLRGDPIYDLTPSIDRQTFASRRDLPIPENIFDGSDKAVQQIREFSLAYIEQNPDLIARLADFLGENHHLKTRPAFSLGRFIAGLKAATPHPSASHVPTPVAA